MWHVGQVRTIMEQEQGSNFFEKYMIPGQDYAVWYARFAFNESLRADTSMPLVRFCDSGHMRGSLPRPSLDVLASMLQLLYRSVHTDP